jgi:hypothetical protein
MLKQIENRRSIRKYLKREVEKEKDMVMKSHFIGRESQ